MVNADKPRFGELLAGLAANYNRDVKVEMLALFWAALERYEIDTVSRAVTAHVKSCKWMPTVAELIALADAMSGKSQAHISPDEAWAIAVRSLDESETVVWTQQIAQAWFAAQSVMELGDKVGARKSFLSVYERLVSEATLAGLAPRWQISPGASAELRERRVDEAVRLGRLPGYVLERYRLPAPTQGLQPLVEAISQTRQADAVANLKSIREGLRHGKTDSTDTTARAQAEAEIASRPILGGTERAESKRHA